MSMAASSSFAGCSLTMGLLSHKNVDELSLRKLLGMILCMGGGTLVLATVNSDKKNKEEGK